jgi:regulator of replication initiation timing
VSVEAYPYDEVLADAVEAIAIAQALHREVERLRDELDRVVAANHHYQTDNDSLRRALAHYTDRSDKWCMYGQAWEAWCDGEGTTRPQRQAYGL